MEAAFYLSNGGGGGGGKYLGRGVKEESSASETPQRRGSQQTFAAGRDRTGGEDVSLVAVALECSCLPVFPSCVRNRMEIMSNFCSLMEELSKECVVAAPAAFLQGDKAALT